MTSETVTIKKVTPLRVVERIEPLLPLWCDRLGYARRAEVPHEGRLGFVLLENGAGEVMLQTRASLDADLPAVAAREAEGILYVEVASLEAALRAALAEGSGAELVVPTRTTFYGAREACVVDGAGTLLVFAERA